MCIKLLQCLQLNQMVSLVSVFSALLVFTCCLPCCPGASHSFQENPGRQRLLDPVASLETVCEPCEEKAGGSVVCRDLQSLRLPVGSYLRWMHRDKFNQTCKPAEVQLQPNVLSGLNVSIP